MPRKYCEFPVQITRAYREVTRDGTKGRPHVVAIASDNSIDSYEEYFAESALEDMVTYSKMRKDTKKNEGVVELRETHNSTFAIGWAEDAWLERNSKSGNIEYHVDIALKEEYPAANELYNDIKEGIVDKQLSVGGWVDWDSDEGAFEFEERLETNADGEEEMIIVGRINRFILEHIATTLPGWAANSNTAFLSAVVKSSLNTDFQNKLFATSPVKKGAVPPHGASISDAEGWDGSDAESKLKEWASDEEGTIDFEKYSKGFAWFDDAEPENLGSYKLPHHTIENGELVLVPEGLYAAMAALNGARDGVDIPDADKKGVYNHFVTHYGQLDEEAPELKSQIVEDFVEREEDSWFKRILNKLEKSISKVEMEVSQMSEKMENETAPVLEDEITEKSDESVEVEAVGDEFTEEEIEVLASDAPEEGEIEKTEEDESISEAEELVDEEEVSEEVEKEDEEQVFDEDD